MEPLAYREQFAYRLRYRSRLHAAARSDFSPHDPANPRPLLISKARSFPAS